MPSNKTANGGTNVQRNQTPLSHNGKEVPLSPTNGRRIFIAGAIGATGRTLMTLPQAQDANLVPHYRPTSAEGQTLHPQAAVLDLTDAQALDAAMQGCTTVMQLIGTMRKRFSTGDTYETSDIDTTQYLVDAAKRCGVEHVVCQLCGCGQATSAYLKAKAKAEAIVTEGGLDYTIFGLPPFMARVTVRRGHAFFGCFGHASLSVFSSKMASSFYMSRKQERPSQILEVEFVGSGGGVLAFTVADHQTDRYPNRHGKIAGEPSHFGFPDGPVLGDHATV